jgi:hypothetical protein
LCPECVLVRPVIYVLHDVVFLPFLSHIVALVKETDQFVVLVR